MVCVAEDGDQQAEGDTDEPKKVAPKGKAGAQAAQTAVAGATFDGGSGGASQ
jgi:hypothetical protein